MKAVCNKVSEGKSSQATKAVSKYDKSETISLVDRAANGDFEAFGELYGMYLDQIYRYAFYQVKDKMTAEDITEEVFVKAWNAISSCKGKGHTFSAWLYRIAHNHIVNTLRNMRKCVSMDTEKLIEVSDPKLEVERTLEQQGLLEVLTDLSSNQKQVVLLKFLEDMDNREIAKIMGKSEGAIRILQMRALTALRQKMGGGQYRNEN